MEALGAMGGGGAAGAGAGAAAGGGFMDMLKLLQPRSQPQHPQPPAQQPPMGQTDPSMGEDWLGFLSAGKSPSKTNMQNSQLLKLLNFGANGF